MRRGIRAAAVGLLLAGLAACSGVPEEKLPDSGATLEGTIKYGGEEVGFAQVRASDGKSEAMGSVGEDGRYRLTNVPIGDVRVTVNTKAAMSDFQSAMMAAGYKGADTKRLSKKAVKYVEVPAKYAEFDTSGLKTTVNKGPNTFDIVIPK
jgi:hypothetical protein